MKYKKKFNYNLKTLVPAILLATATTFSGCNKDKQKEKNEETFGYITPKDTVVLYFRTNLQALVSTENGTIDISDLLKYYISRPETNMIYAEPVEWWGGISTNMIHKIRTKYLEPVINASPKIRGRGDFDFVPGRTTEEDSLWFIQNGWTINKER